MQLDGEEHYEVRLDSHFSQGRSAFATLLIPIITGAYIYVSIDPAEVMLGMSVATVAATLLLLPQLTLHFRYWSLNKGASLTATRSGLVVTLMGIDVAVDYSEIESATKNLTYANALGGVRLLPWDSYGYLLVRTRSGTEVILTTLLIPELLLHRLPKVTVVKRFYCWV